MHESTVLLGQDLAFPCPSPGMPEPGAALPSPGGRTTHGAHSNPSEAVVSPSYFPDLSSDGKVTCSPHNPTDPLLPAPNSGTAREAELPLAGACGGAELQERENTHRDETGSVCLSGCPTAGLQPHFSAFGQEAEAAALNGKVVAGCTCL